MFAYVRTLLGYTQARVASAWRPEDRVAWLPLPEVSQQVNRYHATPSTLHASTTPCTSFKYSPRITHGTYLLAYLHPPQADASTSGATPSVNFFGAWVKLQGLKQLPKV